MEPVRRAAADHRDAAGHLGEVEDLVESVMKYMTTAEQAAAWDKAHPKTGGMTIPPRPGDFATY